MASNFKIAGSSVEQLRGILSRNRAGERVGTYAVCSAHPAVLQAAIAQARNDDSILHVESTSSQVNQFGGYTGATPEQFAMSMRELALKNGFAPDRVLLGSDHLGPFAWKNEPAAIAMTKACELAKASVRAGYQKVHFDASMACADDGSSLSEETIAERAAVLCEAVEQELLKNGAERPLYVVGTEVPPPGGEVAEGNCPPPTRAEDVARTLDLFRKAFEARGLTQAWENVIAIVVQPGVEFGNETVFQYESAAARLLLQALPRNCDLVYEAHSTDYQSPAKLAELVRDHFAILKVGPWLTFAYREAVFALSMIERELFARKNGMTLSRVREALEAEMLKNPGYWKSYYQGNEAEVAMARAYSFSDRSRYYWPADAVQEEVKLLVRNLSSGHIPLTLLSQYLALEYEAVREGRMPNSPEALIQEHIHQVLRHYAAACGVLRPVNNLSLQSA
ncbi:MAG TPA: class II D-tagatose-bisphosphate aldolase, non-catalytic subunit [Terriglobales bacterium]|nr:class II D-tagatose-bisphosphate aldolase, non-catalytic subunit [Terriglobales bacterium]